LGDRSGQRGGRLEKLVERARATSGPGKTAEEVAHSSRACVSTAPVSSAYLGRED